MTKRNLSFFFGLFLLMFLFFVAIVAILAVATFRNRLPLVGRGAVALVKIEGQLSDAGEAISQLRRHADNSAVRAIVLRVETPGGAVGCVQELHREVLRARKESGKPVVASMGNVAASGGYYIACAADEVYANPGTVTGSIGVLLETYDLQGLSKKIGVGVNTVKSGKFKDIGQYFREMTAEEKQILQETINDTHDQFLDAILEGRQIELARAHLRRTAKETTPALTADATTEPAKPPSVDRAQAERLPRVVVKDYLRSIADGRVLNGRQAWELGLVDHLGNLQDAIGRAAQLAGIRGKPVVLQEKRKISFWDLLQSRSEVLSRLAGRFGVSLEYRLSLD